MSRTKTAEKIAFETLVTTIKNNLLTNPAWVERAIIVLYDRQTQDEQVAQETGHDNNQGFNKPDARRMSFVAEFLKGGKHLTREKALGVYGVKLQKYAKQLARIAQEKKVAPVAQAA
jgi:hypothetical protein